MNHAKLQLLLARVHYDLAAAQTAPLVAMGARLGWYEQLAMRPQTIAELANAWAVDERVAESWLMNQAAAGYVTYDADARTFALDDEQHELFLSNGVMPATFEFTAGLLARAELVEQGIRDGSGVPVARYGPRIVKLLERLDPEKMNRITRWVSNGIDVLDIGCGSGAMLLELASRFPDSRFVGVDPDLTPTTHVNVRLLTTVPDEQFDLVLTIETLHEVADAPALAQAVRRAVRVDSAWIIVEALVDDDPQHNLNPSGRSIAAIETLYCLPTARARGKGSGFGAIRGERAIRSLVNGAGFTCVQRIDDSQRLVLEVRP